MWKVQIAPRLKGAISFFEPLPKGCGNNYSHFGSQYIVYQISYMIPRKCVGSEGEKKTFGDEWLSHLVTVDSSQWGRRSSKTAFRLFASLCRIEGQKQRRNAQIMQPVTWFESPNRGHTSFGVLKAPPPHLEHNDVSKMGSRANTSTMF